jgi:hypothetical protein
LIEEYDDAVIDNDNDAVIDFLRPSPTEPSPPPAIRLRLAEGIATLAPVKQIVNDELDFL